MHGNLEKVQCFFVCICVYKVYEFISNTDDVLQHKCGVTCSKLYDNVEHVPPHWWCARMVNHWGFFLHKLTCFWFNWFKQIYNLELWGKTFVRVVSNKHPFTWNGFSQIYFQEHFVYDRFLNFGAPSFNLLMVPDNMIMSFSFWHLLCFSVNN